MNISRYKKGIDEAEDIIERFINSLKGRARYCYEMYVNRGKPGLTHFKGKMKYQK